MHVTDLALNRTLGMQLACPGENHLLAMPESPLLLNHLGTIHASAQFALAEACSGEFLLRQLNADKARTLAVLRTSEVKFRKPAQGALRAFARFTEGNGESLSAELKTRGRALAGVVVEIRDASGVITMTGEYSWFLQGNL